MAAMPALISSKIWFLFIALTVVVVVGSPTTDLLESVDCLLRDCVCYFTNADRHNDRFSLKLASDRQNTTHKPGGGGGGYSHTLPIRVCGAQRGRDFEAPDLERGIHFRGVF